MKNTDPKVIFRRSKQWKTFRQKIKKNQKTDPVTGSQLVKQYNLHHLDLNPKNYTNIEDESHFIGLNPTTHECLHFLYGDSQRKFDWRKRLKRLEELCILMEQIEQENSK